MKYFPFIPAPRLNSSPRYSQMDSEAVHGGPLFHLPASDAGGEQEQPGAHLQNVERHFPASDCE